MAEATGNDQFKEQLDKIANDRAAGVRDPRAGITG
jgi:hypothetical protein